MKLPLVLFLFFVLSAANVAAYDYNAIVVYGQSLGAGNKGCPALSTTQPFSNLKINASNTALVDLIENSTCVGGVGDYQESPDSGIGNQLRQSIGSGIYLLINRSVGGQAYASLKKGTSYYDSLLTAITAAKNLSESAGKTFGVIAVVWIHGESDYSLANLNYKLNLESLQIDLETDIKTITSQVGTVPLFISQFSAYNGFGGGPCYTGDTSIYACPTLCADGTPPNSACNESYPLDGSPINQWVAAKENPSKIYLVGPKYQYEYSDGLHLTNTSYRAMGETIGKSIASYLLSGTWKPLVYKSVSYSSSTTIDVQFWVPVGQLAWDISTVTKVTTDSVDTFGFEFRQDAVASPKITAVEIVGTDIVRITLESQPTGTNQRIRYAYKGQRYALGGDAGNAHGNLCDTDPQVSQSGGTIKDWATTFEAPIGATWPSVQAYVPWVN